MTVSLVASIPAIVVFLIFQKQIIQGVAMTGIKG
jgi:multiple sugar transport system permease protein